MTANEILAWVIVIALIVAPFVWGLVAAERQRRAHRERHKEEYEFFRVTARMASQRNFEMKIGKSVAWDMEMAEIVPTEEFKAWAREHLSGPLDIEYVAVQPFIFIKDENEAFAYRMRWA